MICYGGSQLHIARIKVERALYSVPVADPSSDPSGVRYMHVLLQVVSTTVISGASR